jgi:putative ABC transport system permease protein
VAPVAGGDSGLALSLFVCVVLVLAFSALSPLVVPLVGHVLGLPVRRWLLGQLAHANLRDGVRRSAATAAPTLVLVVLVAGIGGTLDAITAGSREEALRTLKGDLVVTANRSSTAELAAVDGVRAFSQETSVTFHIENGSRTRERWSRRWPARPSTRPPTSSPTTCRWKPAASTPCGERRSW